MIGFLMGLSPARWMAIGALGVALGASHTGCYVKGRSDMGAKAERRMAAMQQNFNKAVDEHAEAARLAESRLQFIKAVNEARVAEADAALAKEKSDVQALKDRWRIATSERDSVRKQLDAYASGGTTADGDTLPACRSRAAALKDVLDFCVQEHRESVGALAGAAEGHAGDVRSLLAGWPVSSPTTESKDKGR